MPARLFREWLEYEQLEPFGQWRDNFHAAMIASILATVNRDPKKQPQPIRLSEFFYVDAETERENADQQLLGTLRAVSKTKTKAKAKRKEKRRG
jgi:hypothetical protein